jgi:hypothetical protein
MRRLVPIALAIALLLVGSPADAANRLYAKYRQALVSYSSAGLSAAVDLATDTIKIAAVTGSYTPNTTTDQFYTAISANVVGTPQTLTYASSTAGLYKSSNNPAFTVPASTTVTYLVIYKDTGTAATSPLLALFDTGTNIPYTQGSSSGTLNVTMDATNGWYTP